MKKVVVLILSIVMLAACLTHPVKTLAQLSIVPTPFNSPITKDDYNLCVTYIHCGKETVISPKIDVEKSDSDTAVKSYEKKSRHVKNHGPLYKSR